jgi:hypothetical protein
MVPSALDHLAKTCLAKNPEDRWQTAHEVIRELKWAAEEKKTTVVPWDAAPAGRQSRMAWIVAGMAALGFAIAVVPASRFLLELPKDTTLRRFRVDVPPMPNPLKVSISPDGSKLLFVAFRPDNRNVVLWLRSIDKLDFRPLPGTDNANQPFWSPDSRFIGFFADGKLKKIDTLEERRKTFAITPLTAKALSLRLRTEGRGMLMA